MLKVTIKCTCGCKYELLSSAKHDLIKCPNCGEPFIDSEKLNAIFKAYTGILSSQETLPDMNRKQELQIETISEWEQYGL